MYREDWIKHKDNIHKKIIYFIDSFTTFPNPALILVNGYFQNISFIPINTPNIISIKSFVILVMLHY